MRKRTLTPRLGWRQASRDELAEHLRTVQVLASEAVGDASLYRCRGDGGESIAIALPGEAGLIIAVHGDLPAELERRRPADDASGQ